MDHWNASANIKDDCRKFIENVRSNPHLKDSDLRANGYKTLVDTINTSRPSRAISPVETKLLSKQPGQKSILISYFDQQQAIAKEIDGVFTQAGYLVIRHQPGDNVNEFSDVIPHRNLDYVLVVLSDNYLKNDQCMHAVNQIMRRYKFHDTLITYVLTDDNATKADIYPGGKGYEDYWDEINARHTADDCREFIKTVYGKLHLREDVLMKGNGYNMFLDTINELEKRKPKTLSIEQKIQQIKEEALGNQDVQNDLAAYIPVLGSRVLFDPKEQTFDLDQAVNQFLAGDRKVFLLLGDSGGGKSTYLRSLENRLWKEWDPTKPIPIFISLPTLKQPFNDAITETLKQKGFTDTEIKDLKNKYSFLFLLDGYDELKQKGNLYDSNQLDQWKGQTIITCRTQYLSGEQSSYRNYFAPRNQSTSLDEASVSPFNSKQIEAYCRKYIQLNGVSRTWEQYQADIASVPDLADFIVTPFLLRIVVEVLPDMIKAHTASKSQEQLKILRIEIFDAFVNKWFDREEQRIIRISRTEVDVSDLKRNFANFATRLALEMTQDNIVSIDYELDPFEHNKWDKYFGQDPIMTLIRSGVPLRKVGPHSYAFIHKSLLEYFCARAIIR